MNGYKLHFYRNRWTGTQIGYSQNGRLPKSSSNKRIDYVKMYDGVGCASGGGFNPASPPNNSPDCVKSPGLVNYTTTSSISNLKTIMYIVPLRSLFRVFTQSDHLLGSGSNAYTPVLISASLFKVTCNSHIKQITIIVSSTALLSTQATLSVIV